MSFKTLEYPLVNGFINNWLVTGAVVVDLNASSALIKNPAWLADTFNQQHKPDLLLQTEPVDRGSVATESSEVKWHYVRCQPDHLVQVSGKAPVTQYGYALAYAELQFSEPFSGTLSLRADGPADVWLNGSQIYRKSSSGLENSAGIPVEFLTQNKIIVRFEWIACGAFSTSIALKVGAAAIVHSFDTALVRLNTQSKYPQRQQILEEVLEKVHLEDIVNHRGQKINLIWDESATEELRYAYQIQDDKANIYIDGSWDVDASKPFDVGHPASLAERSYRVVIKSPTREYFEMGMRYQRDLPIDIVDNAYSEASYGTFDSRRQEALADAARRSGNLFFEAAKLALGQWNKVEWDTILKSCDQAARSEMGSEALLVGLLGLLERYGQEAEFRADIKDRIQSAAMKFDYNPDRFNAESSMVLASTAAVLAGQKFSPAPVDRSEMETHLLELLPKKGRAGFEEWGSNAAIEGWIVALSALTSLASNEALSEIAAVLLDKVLFLMAVNNFKGAQATPQAVGGRLEIKSARLNPLAGVQRLLWGAGIFNRYCAGTVSIASSAYEFPSFFSEIANRLMEESEAIESHRTARGDALLYTYKTPDFAMSSVQSYRPGEEGRAEHIWQALMGTEAIVFTNHPASMHETDAPAPGFWLGNASLPKVAQWKDILVAMYNLPENDWLGFTHAYFPVHAFDEYRLEGGWAFARKGSAYLALHARQGMALIKQGAGAYTELRSEGHHNTWICVMGREAQYEDFRGFQKKVLKTHLAEQHLTVQVKTHAGDELSLEWLGTLRVNGEEKMLAGSTHLNNPNCTMEMDSPTMDVLFDGTGLRLNFE